MSPSAAGYVVFQQRREDDWRILGEVDRRPGLPARKARAQAIRDVLGREPRDSEVFAVLLSAVTSPTDAAAVFSVLRSVPLRASVRGTLGAESGLNDAPIVIIVSLVSAGCGLAVSIVGGLTERRRPFSLLRLAGVPLGLLRRVVLLESLVPLASVAVLVLLTQLYPSL